MHKMSMTNKQHNKFDLNGIIFMTASVQTATFLLYNDILPQYISNSQNYIFGMQIILAELINILSHVILFGNLILLPVSNYPGPNARVADFYKSS